MSSCRPNSILTRAARAGFWSSLLLVAGFALYPDLTLPEPAMTRGFTDKIYHVAGFAGLAALASVGWRVSKVMLTALALTAIGLELLQIFAQGRGIFLNDILANFAGIGLGLVLAWSASPGNRHEVGCRCRWF